MLNLLSRPSWRPGDPPEACPLGHAETHAPDAYHEAQRNLRAAWRTVAAQGREVAGVFRRVAARLADRSRRAPRPRAARRDARPRPIAGRSTRRAHAPPADDPDEDPAPPRPVPAGLLDFPDTFHEPAHRERHAGAAR